MTSCTRIVPVGAVVGSSSFQVDGSVVSSVSAISVNNIVVGGSTFVLVPVGPFDGDLLGISCDSAPGALPASAQAQLDGFQLQLTALASGTQSAPVNPEILAAEGALFGVVLVAASVVYGVKRLLRLFSSNPDA